MFAFAAPNKAQIQLVLSDAAQWTEQPPVDVEQALVPAEDQVRAGRLSSHLNRLSQPDNKQPHADALLEHTWDAIANPVKASSMPHMLPHSEQAQT